MAHPGTTIRKLLEAEGISEHELARRTRLKQPTIHRILNGDVRQPRRSSLEPIARYFKVSIEDLYNDTTETDQANPRARANALYDDIMLLPPAQRQALLARLAASLSE